MKINKNSHEVPKSWLKTFGQSTDNKNIGILTPGYGLEKVSYGLNPKNISYKKLNRIPIQRLVSGDNIFTQCPYLIGGKVDLVHSFNMLPLNKNFIVSFETELPRFLGNQNKRHIEFGYEILRSDRCKGIYALSDAGKQFAIKRMRDKGFHDLVDKVGIYRGGINISNPHIFDRESGGPIKACFIGASLFHKGIEPVLDALIELRTGGVDVEITVIGRPFPSSYAFTGMTFDSNKLMTTLEREHWINYYPVLPNSDVIDILYKSDILLFPSFDESLG
jgi:glycosyltransferase involved in cell wall biosynthesis